jgi:hypothetical protein
MSVPGVLLLTLVPLGAVGPGRVISLRAEGMGPREALKVVAAGDLGKVAVTRQGTEVVISTQSEASAEILPPAVSAPLESVRIERSSAGMEVRVKVDRQVPYEVRRDPSMLTVVFGAASAPAPAPVEPVTASTDIHELYRRILPVAPVEGTDAGAESVTAAGMPSGPEHGEGFSLGSLQVHPSLTGILVDGNTTAAGPQPIHDRYYEIRPSVNTQMPMGAGVFNGGYEARIRRGSTIEAVKDTSHLLTAGVDLPIGPSLQLRGGEHYARGTLEANEVDPGGEYFFQLGRYRHNEISGSARLQMSPSLDMDVSGSWTTVRLSSDAAFSDYDVRHVGSSLGYDTTGGVLRIALAYGRDEIPAPLEHRQAQSVADSVGIQVKGELLPLVDAEIGVGYRNQRSPEAGPGGTRYSGLAGSVRLIKSFSRGSRVVLLVGRATPVSNFENNAFYVSTSGEVELDVALPYELSVHGAVGYHVNGYRTLATELGAEREDRILGWSIGVGRPINRWSFFRADYRRDRRSSNLDMFDVQTHALTVQLGVGLFGTAERRP